MKKSTACAPLGACFLFPVLPQAFQSTLVGFFTMCFFFSLVIKLLSVHGVAFKLCPNQAGYTSAFVSRCHHHLCVREIIFTFRLFSHLSQTHVTTNLIFQVLESPESLKWGSCKQPGWGESEYCNTFILQNAAMYPHVDFLMIKSASWWNSIISWSFVVGTFSNKQGFVLAGFSRLS